MEIEIDRRKCGSEFSLCKRCKYEDEYGSERCIYCTKVVNIGYSMILCGIPVGSGISWFHQNFEEKDLARLQKQIAEAVSIYPDFNFEKELENEEFKRLLSVGVTVKNAYEVTHIDEIVKDGDTE